LCIVQLFGSDSGFVVSHAALASGSCTAALIPEVDFSMERLSKYLCGRLQKEQLAAKQYQSPYGIVLLAETAIPQDVEEYIDSPLYPNLYLHEDERAAIREFVGSSLLNMKDIGQKIEGKEGNDWTGFYAALAANADSKEKQPGRLFWDLLPEYLREVVRHSARKSVPGSPLDGLVLNALNSILKRDDIPWNEDCGNKVVHTPPGADVLALLERINARVQAVAESAERPGKPVQDAEFNKDMMRLQSLPVSYEAIELAKVLQDSRNLTCMSPREYKRILQRISQRLVEKRNRLLIEACCPDCIREARRLPGGRRVHGQTQDELRTGGLKVVAHVLQSDIRNPEKMPDEDKYWNYYRVFTNEPRHLLRAIAPSVSDVVFGQRLGTLAVDNAMAGYTDFMVSQWLTEYVLVPLKLVVLGRKRVPQNGIFWKSVLATTGQDAEMLWERQSQGTSGLADR
jgi:6-phosphofructokinase